MDLRVKSEISAGEAGMITPGKMDTGVEHSIRIEFKMNSGDRFILREKIMGYRMDEDEAELIMNGIENGYCRVEVSHEFSPLNSNLRGEIKTVKMVNENSIKKIDESEKVDLMNEISRLKNELLSVERRMLITETQYSLPG